MSDQFYRSLWQGTMMQNAPLEWEGPMEIYLKYDPEEDYPISFSGVITWNTLGKARTEIEGQLNSNNEISFHETRCLSGGCDQVVLGGSYSAKISKDNLSGKASAFGGLSGTFSLHKKS